MNKSPELFDRDLRLEQTLERAAQAPREPELAADWSLKCELAGLATEPLPDRLRRRVLAQARVVSDRRPVWLLATAAALFTSLAVAFLIQLPVPRDAARGLVEVEPAGVSGHSSVLARRDAMDLQLALNTIQQTSLRATWLAGRGLSEHLNPGDVDLGLRQLPYVDVVRSAFQSSNRTPASFINVPSRVGDRACGRGVSKPGAAEACFPLR
ncbi:MAG: hypothetical protein ABR550_12260 [Wenzhouxiangellaceae bacterium]